VHSTDDECAETMEVQFPGVSLFRSFDYNYYQVPQGEVTMVTYERLLRARRLPEVIYFSEEFITPVMNEQRTSVILFTANPNLDKSKPHFKAFSDLATEVFD